MQTSPAVEKATRSLWAIVIARWIIGVAFLFAAFTAFPEYKWVIGLGLLLFNLGIEGVGSAVTGLSQAQNYLDDLAERKTRHTILLAAERSHDIGDSILFWSEVDRRVEAEMGPPTPPTGFWKSAGLVIGATAGRLAGDIFGIGLVAALTG